MPAQMEYKNSSNWNAFNIAENIPAFDIDWTGKYLDNIQAIMTRQLEGSDNKKAFEAAIAVIRTRQMSAELSLAVIGQFSSGKSTFINALLRQSVLKAKNAVCTAAATFIRFAQKISIEVTFYDDYIITATENDLDELHYHFERFYPGLVEQPRDLLWYMELLITNQRIAAAVTRLNLYLPSINRFLNNTVIIDTPGLFAGADHTQTHEAITQSVIDNDADLAIVLIPSHQAMSKTLSDFLRNLPTFILNRCVFILSRMDMVEAEEHQQLLFFTRNQLVQKLGIKEPLLLSCGAIAMLPEAQRIFDQPQQIDFWQHSFIALENQLKDMLAKNRSLIIQEKLKFLLQNLLKAMGNRLDEEQEKLQQEDSLLKKQEIKNVTFILDALIRDAGEQLSQKQEDISSTASNYSERAKTVKDLASRKVNYAGDDILENDISISNSLASEIKKELEIHCRFVNVRIAELGALCNNLTAKFEQQFKTNYAAFPYLDNKIIIEPVKVAAIKFPHVDFSSFLNTVRQTNEEGRKGRNTGAVIGGAAGMILGPITAMAGAWIGARIGKMMNQGSIDELKEQLKAQLSAAVDNCFRDSIQVIIVEIRRIVSDALEQFKAICESHKSKYGKDIQQIEQSYIERRSALENRLNAAENDRELLSVMMEKLQ